MLVICGMVGSNAIASEPETLESFVTIENRGILLHVTPAFVEELRKAMADNPIGELNLAVFAFDDTTQTWNRSRSVPCQKEGVGTNAKNIRRKDFSH